MARTCLECDAKISGRADKRFCSDYCRNVYNNRLNRDDRSLMRNVHNRLRKNYRILEELNPNGKTTIQRNTMLNKDFDFTYITEVYTTKKGTQYFFVYDQGYLILDDPDKIVLVKREK